MGVLELLKEGYPFTFSGRMAYAVTKGPQGAHLKDFTPFTVKAIPVYGMYSPEDLEKYASWVRECGQDPFFDEILQDVYYIDFLTITGTSRHRIEIAYPSLRNPDNTWGLYVRDPAIQDPAPGSH
jgi:hypothetical protein